MLGRLAKGGLKKEHEAELEDSDADTRALGVLGTGTGKQTCLLAPAAQWHLRGCLAGALRASTLAVKSRRAILCASFCLSEAPVPCPGQGQACSPQRGTGSSKGVPGVWTPKGIQKMPPVDDQLGACRLLKRLLTEEPVGPKGRLFLALILPV